MDDTFGMLASNSLSPERKLAAAITTGMPDAVQQLIKEGGARLVNAVLQQANGRAALHIACQAGRHSYIPWLVEAGADPSQMDFFGMTPLDMALRSGHEMCVREMLSVSSCCNPATLWTAQTRAGALSWQTFSVPIIAELIIATPDVNKFRETSRILGREFFRNAQKNELLIRAYLLTGNKLEDDDAAQITIFGEKELTDWITSLKKTPATLQHLARVAVRRGIQCCIHYAVRQLELPRRLQKYLVLADECSDSEMLQAGRR